MIVLIKLIVAHFTGDFLLQPKSWVEEKERLKAKSGIFYLHTLFHGLLILLVLWDLRQWLLALTLMLLHGMIDIIKLYLQKNDNKSEWFLTDQALHGISITIVWVLFFQPEIRFNALLQDSVIWIYVAALLFITVVSAIIMRELMSGWAKALNENNEESLNNAGKYIGMLERIFVFIFVVTGNWEGIGFLLAAKSVFRFGDLKESKSRKLTEYILIGTFLSFSIALFAGLAVLKYTS